MTDLDHQFCMWYFSYVYDGQPQQILFIFSYSDPLKKVVLSEVGAPPKMLYVQHFWHGGEVKVACLKRGKKHAKNAVRTAFLEKAPT